MDYDHLPATDSGMTWYATLRRFLIAIAMCNLIWETGHMPFYTLWLTGTWGQISFGILHCTAGDILIATTCLIGAILTFGSPAWPQVGYSKVGVMMMIAALSFTVYSEWLNIEVRHAWAYRDIMPTIPVLNTGLSPVLQWIIIPLVSFRIAKYPRFR